MHDTTYYDTIAPSYNALHEQEQLRKLRAIAGVCKPTGLLLDVGCGTGISTDFFSDVCECTGIDPSAELISQNKNDNCTFIIGSAEELPFNDCEFDVVLSLSAIQNFSDIEKGLHEIKRVGKDVFILSWLKKSAKSEHIYDAVQKIFGKPVHVINDMHDTIVVYST